MKSHEFINEGERPPPGFINKQVNKKLWKRIGSGADVSVWQHIADPDTVVKIVGGGKMPTWQHGSGVKMYAKFCVDHANKSKHFPKVLDINNDDPEVCQIRVEKLLPLPGISDSLGHFLKELAEHVKNDYWGNTKHNEYIVNRVQKEMDKLGLSEFNTIDDIMKAVKLLVDSTLTYAKQFNHSPLFDVHSANWMMRSDRTIVLSDPWH